MKSKLAWYFYQLNNTLQIAHALGNFLELAAKMAQRDQVRLYIPRYYFYLHKKLLSEVAGKVSRRLFHCSDHVLAQIEDNEVPGASSLFAVDSGGSPLVIQALQGRDAAAYLPYGFEGRSRALNIVPGFNGEPRDAGTGHYLLGAGYRLFNGVLMRFNSPDSWSPFGAGGLNTYVYCLSDPVNRSDPSGHSGRFARARRSKSAAPSTQGVPRNSRDTAVDFVGYHGSAAANAKSLTSGLSGQFMGTAGGLSAGAGFYVVPKRGIAKDFAEVAASYSNSTPQVFTVFVRDFHAMLPDKHYRFATMGEGGLRMRDMNEMEIVFREPTYQSIIIRTGTSDQRIKRPRPHEAPF